MTITPHQPCGQLLPQGEKRSLKLGIVAGEPSGDLLGANLIHELHRSCPDLQVSGLGGEKMIAAGCQSIANMERLSVMGLLEPLLHLPDLFKLRRELLNYFLSNKPDVFVGIDSPDFNLGLELKLRKAGIPVVHYVSPSVWAWRQKRVKKIALATDLVLTLFPFEVNFYQRYNVQALFVGHPLADLIPMVNDQNAARAQLHLNLDATYIALFPGSRRSEIVHMAKLFIETAVLLLQKKPNVRLITSAVNARHAAVFQAVCKKIAPTLPIQFFIGQSHTVMAAADVILLKSGTATLEAMLIKRPMVIAHRLDALTYQIARRVVKVPFIGLPNLLANKALVPEFIQGEACPSALAGALIDYLDSPEKVAELTQQFIAMHEQLRCNANQKAAEAVKSFL